MIDIIRRSSSRDAASIGEAANPPAAWTDAQHLEPYTATDGPTDIDNLAGLCRHHHRVTHRNGWQMQATADGWFWWTTPNGDEIWSQRHGTRRAGPAPPRE